MAWSTSVPESTDSGMMQRNLTPVPGPPPSSSAKLVGASVGSSSPGPKLNCEPGVHAGLSR